MLFTASTRGTLSLNLERLAQFCSAHYLEERSRLDSVDVDLLLTDGKQPH